MSQYGSTAMYGLNQISRCLRESKNLYPIMDKCGKIEKDAIMQSPESGYEEG